MIASAAPGQRVSGSIPVSGKVLMGRFRFFEDFSRDKESEIVLSSNVIAMAIKQWQ